MNDQLMERNGSNYVICLMWTGRRIKREIFIPRLDDLDWEWEIMEWMAWLGD